MASSSECASATSRPLLRMVRNASSKAPCQRAKACPVHPSRRFVIRPDLRLRTTVEREEVLLVAGGAGRRWIQQTAVAVVGLAIGVGTVAAFRASAPAATRQTQPASVTHFSFTDGSLPPVTVAPAVTPAHRLAEEPATAESALTSFLQWLAEGRPELSHALLDASSRARYPSTASWSRAQADMPRSLGFEIGPARRAFAGDGGVVEIEVTSTHRPSVDAFRGLVPGRSHSLWQVRQERDGWRVAAEPVSIRPVLPAEASAPEAVKGWVGRLQACDPEGAVALQVSRYLYGPADFVRAPCEKQGQWSVGSPVGLDRAPDPSDMVAAFGPSVGAWTRLVPVDGPGGRFFAVVAPMGDVWQVAGVAVRG